MTAGGNSTLKSFFESYNMPSTADIEFKYSTVAAKYYREMLKVMAEGETCTMVTPSVEEGLTLITGQTPVKVEVPEEEKKENKGYFSGMIGSAINTTVGIGKNIYGKVKQIETYQKIENKAVEAANIVGENIKWGAQKGKETIGKTVEIGKETINKTVEIGRGGIEKTVEIGKGSIGWGVEKGRENLEWGVEKGRENLEWGANAGYNLGSKGVNIIKSGATGAYDTLTGAAANTYNNLKVGEKTRRLKEESMNVLANIERKIGRNKTGEENKAGEEVNVIGEEEENKEEIIIRGEIKEEEMKEVEKNESSE